MSFIIISDKKGLRRINREESGSQVCPRFPVWKKTPKFDP
jgi:hypothetical protein